MKPALYKERKERLVRLGQSIRAMPQPAPTPERPKIPAASIIAATCLHFRVSRLDLCSHRKYGDLALQRQIAFYLCRRFTALTFPQIGQQFGGYDRTTVTYGCGQIESLLTTDPAIRRHINGIRKILGDNENERVLAIISTRMRGQAVPTAHLAHGKNYSEHAGAPC